MYFEYIHSEIIDDRIDAQFFTPEYIKSLKKINQFRIETLGNISRRIFDPPHTAPEFVDKSDFEMIMIENITLNGIEGNFRAISETCHKDIFKNSHLEGNELLVSRVGNSSGTFASVFPCYKGKNVSGNISIIKLKDEIIDKEYAFAYFNSNIGQNSIKRNIANTARKFLTISKIREFQVPIPSPEIQKYIGDKVRKAEELREEAKRLKKEAEEILINEIGFNNVNKGNAKYHWIKEDIVDDRIDSDFYDLKYQVLIEIEKKFNCYLMEDIIVDKYTGKTPGKEYDDIKGIPLIVVKNVEENILNLDNIDRRIKDNNSFKKTEENDLLITRVGSVGVVSIVEENEKGLFLSDNVICLKLKEGLFNRYIAFYLNSIYGKLMVERWTKGAVQGVINYESINKFKIPIMDNNIMKEIDLKILKWKQLLAISKQLIQEAKQDVEDLIEGNFDMSKVKANS
jgi:type I restriction enzyme S subunit